MAGLRIPVIVENKGKKALGDVDKGVKGLTKSFSKLAGLAGIGLSTAAIINFGKQAAKAFITDEKAASQLALSVKNLGLAFDLPAINGFIDKLSLSAGVADDKLRPAMQKLLQVTGSVSKSQELLIQALDISRASGIEYETVVQDLANAYVGNTKGLKKYNLGLTAAELKTMKFADAQEKLNKTFKGGSAAYLKTYAGQMEILTVAAGEASEKIGKGLMDALMILTGDTTVEELSDTMLELADNTAVALTNLGKFGKGVIDVFGPIATFLEDFIIKTQPFVDLIVEGNPAGFMDKPRTTARRFFAGGQDSLQFARDSIARRKAEAEAAKRAKALAAMQTKALADAKKKAALEKAARTLEIDRINIAAALKGKISETDRISLELQKAILDGNGTLAEKLAKDLEAAVKRNNDLQKALLATPEAPNPYRNWKAPNMGGIGGALGLEDLRGQSAAIPSFNDMTKVGVGGALGLEDLRGRSAAVPQINITVELDGQTVGGAIREGQINDSLSGSFNQVNRGSGFKGAIAI
jgi:hypothetical protein